MCSPALYIGQSRIVSAFLKHLENSNFKLFQSYDLDQKITEIVNNYQPDLVLFGHNNVLKRKNVRIGLRNFGKVEILSGLEIGDNIVAEGTNKVRNKAKVKIKK